MATKQLTLSVLKHSRELWQGNVRNLLVSRVSTSGNWRHLCSKPQQELRPNDTNLLEFKGEWSAANKDKFIRDMRVVVDFITEDEEAKLLEEIEPYMKRLRYEYDHWDDAIHGFRETERKHWYPHNRQVLERVRVKGFQEEIMPYVHILDLAAEGVIKPHIDSTRYCGHTIAGISLLSDSVMRLVYAINKTESGASEDYRSQPKAILENNYYVDILLPRRSLYIMSHYARYDFTHEILANKESSFMGQPIKKDRRISIICRNEP
ncbi:alpha-ketoglutarate-dependent dioxygenase alkB homolog 7, mitochondrial [Musca domestica]|uniref:Alpha-ketoglutarate-dependent dioxygenase alkB homolog 7, mitochondrial n=1 Tax=Musca domestica TaxID=7370 RepID=A0A1I8M6Z5_MUSDO|nr:alpha-ketoglutarate-dependent dioxygenase alkB homolog 7, mitochondrial [Musca domestica]